MLGAGGRRLSPGAGALRGGERVARGSGGLRPDPDWIGTGKEGVAAWGGVGGFWVGVRVSGGVGWPNRPGEVRGGPAWSAEPTGPRGPVGGGVWPAGPKPRGQGGGFFFSFSYLSYVLFYFIFNHLDIQKNMFAAL